MTDTKLVAVQHLQQDVWSVRDSIAGSFSTLPFMPAYAAESKGPQPPQLLVNMPQPTLRFS